MQVYALGYDHTITILITVIQGDDLKAVANTVDKEIGLDTSITIIM